MKKLLSPKTALLASASLLPVFPFTAALAFDDVKRDEIIVTASPLGRPIDETIIGVTVISAEELDQRLENSIGETLRREPGISSTFFGPGASRPIIRGLAGDRISVLDAGIGAIDASATSPDHAVAIEPAAADKIEIVRGSGMLLYGSSAAGGVVNVFSGRIPREAPEDGKSGAIRIGGASVDDSIDASGAFDLTLGRVGDGVIVFHGEGGHRRADDYNIPGFAESARLRALEEAEEDEEDHDDAHGEEEEVFGIVENSAFETTSGGAGLSYIFDSGFFGASVSTTNTTYGVPGGHGHHEEEEGEEHDDDEHGEEEEEGGVSIELEQIRFDVDGEIATDLGLFNKAKFRFGYADYEHREIEPSGEIGTTFLNEGWEARLELIEKTFSALGGEVRGASGAQFKHREFIADGEEAFTPPTSTNRLGLFTLKEYARGDWRIEGGARYEHTEHEVTTTGETRTFDSVSVSAGVGVNLDENAFFGVNVMRTERAPGIEELFSDGAHLATNAYEVGDPDLGLETARGVEATLRLSYERVAFAINGFYTSYKDFIYERPTGAEIEELPVFEFVAEDVEFRGFEIETEIEIARFGEFDLHTDHSVDFVQAEIDGGAFLPRIPPLKGISGIGLTSPKTDLRAEFEWAAAQNDVAANELPTDGYQMINLSADYHLFDNGKGPSVRFQVNNVTNEEARLHTSFLKDVAPLAGRNFKIVLRGDF